MSSYAVQVTNVVPFCTGFIGNAGVDEDVDGDMAGDDVDPPPDCPRARATRPTTSIPKNTAENPLFEIIFPSAWRHLYWEVLGLRGLGQACCCYMPSGLDEAVPCVLLQGSPHSQQCLPVVLGLQRDDP